MKHKQSRGKYLITAVLFMLFNLSVAAERVSEATRSKLATALPVFGLQIGDEVLLRTFKEESQLELWMRPKNSAEYRLFKTYPICYFSGGPGPKRREGDKVTPEGFYSISADRLNPNSRFHLSMNIGYPNAYDKQLGRNGSLLMIHGACDSVGCFAMNNDQIEEIYYLVEQALEYGQPQVPVHAFPFHLSDEKLAAQRHNRWYGFWVQLQIGYRLFNEFHRPPIIEAIAGRYVLSMPPE